MAKKTSRKTFTRATKEEAVAAMAIGNLTQKEIAKKYGCSVPALQLWRKELQNSQTTTDDWDEQEDSWDEQEDDSYDEAKGGCDQQEAPSVCKHTTDPKQEDTAHEVMRKFWNKNYRGVDMLLSPKSLESDEVIKLVNDAIQFAIESK